MREIVLDTETTGLNHKAGDRIIEVGCVELINHVSTTNNLHFYCSTNKIIDKSATKIHGLTNDFLNEYPPFKEHVKKFLAFIGNDPLIIHNAEFDLTHLNNELQLIGKNKINKNSIIDTLDLARDKFPGLGISLDALCKRYRIDNSKRKKHTALIDCELLSRVYINLIDQKEPMLDFKTTNQNNQYSENQNSKDYFKKIVVPSSEELKLHKEYLKKSLKKNYFN